MKKLTLAAAAALALASAAPASADTAKTSADPFVSSQASLGLLAGAGGVAVAATVLAVIVVAADGDT